MAQVKAESIRQSSEESSGDLSLGVDPPSLYPDMRDNPHLVGS